MLKTTIPFVILLALAGFCCVCGCAGHDIAPMRAKVAAIDQSVQRLVEKVEGPAAVGGDDATYSPVDFNPTAAPVFGPQGQTIQQFPWTLVVATITIAYLAGRVVLGVARIVIDGFKWMAKKIVTGA